MNPNRILGQVARHLEHNSEVEARLREALDGGSKSLVEVAREWGVSRQRIHQLVKRYGLAFTDGRTKYWNDRIWYAHENP
jgi:transcriptional regulator of acetoin/glycerol metabolism